MIAFSDDMRAAIRGIRAFLFDNMYRAPRIMAQRARVTRVLETLFPLYLGDPGLLPRRWQVEIDAARGTDAALARLVADYIAGMTDRFALQEHARLTGRSALEDMH